MSLSILQNQRPGGEAGTFRSRDNMVAPETGHRGAVRDARGKRPDGLRLGTRGARTVAITSLLTAGPCPGPDSPSSQRDGPTQPLSPPLQQRP